MKRFKAVVGSLVLLAAGVASASVVAGKSPASILQTTATTGTTTATTGTTTATTGTTGTTGTTATTGTTGTTTTPPPARKVTLCHHTGSRKNPHRTITVSSNATQAHMRHGDTPGPCTTSSNVTRHSATAHVRRFHRATTLRAELKAEAKAKKGKGKGKGKGR
jgi:hypothetical protein